MRIAKLPNGKPEIYPSLQGEGLRIGEKQIFVRCYGCNLDCSWCDSKYATKSGDYLELTPKEVFEYISIHGHKSVCITGGEPLIQRKELRELLKLLQRYNYYVHLCTNGTIWDQAVFYLCDFISMDMKPPSSGMKSNLQFLKRIDKEPEGKFEVKVVVGSREDLRFALGDVYPEARNFTLILQPEWNELTIHQLVEGLLGYNLKNVRVLPQLQKFIWGMERAR